MKFHYVVAFLTSFSTVLAVPTAPTPVKRDCDIAKCVIALAPTVLTCTRAAAAQGLDTFANAGCLAAAANVAANMPAACDTCLKEYGIPEKIEAAGQTIKNAAGDVKVKVDEITGNMKVKVDEISHELADIHLGFPHVKPCYSWWCRASPLIRRLDFGKSRHQ